MNRYEINRKIQEELDGHETVTSNQESEADTANFAIERYFNNEKKVEDDIDTSLSINGNIGAVLLPENGDN